MRKPALKPPEPITCVCGFKIWDGEVVRARVLRLRNDGQFEAKCKCKRWVALPVKLAGTAGEG